MSAVEATAQQTATHRCKVCGALWRLWQPGEARLGDKGSWSCALPAPGRDWSYRCGSCCDNVAMGDQIERLATSALIIYVVMYSGNIDREFRPCANYRSEPRAAFYYHDAAARSAESLRLEMETRTGFKHNGPFKFDVIATALEGNSE